MMSNIFCDKSPFYNKIMELTCVNQVTEQQKQKKRMKKFIKQIKKDMIKVAKKGKRELSKYYLNPGIEENDFALIEETFAEFKEAKVRWGGKFTHDLQVDIKW